MIIETARSHIRTRFLSRRRLLSSHTIAHAHKHCFISRGYKAMGAF